MKKIFFVSLLFFCGFFINSVFANSLQSDSLVVKGISRHFEYYVPNNLGKDAAVIFVLHGSKSSGRVMRYVTGREFETFADSSKNAIIVYPEGFKKYWDDCRKSASYEAKVKHIDDIGFIEKMIDYLHAKYGISRKKVFALGHSNGGQMCYKLALEKPELFRGIAVISANLPVNSNNDCKNTNEPISILIMNGTTDPINPYNGGKIPVFGGIDRGSVLSTNQSIQYFLHLNQSDSLTPKEYDYPDISKEDSSVVKRYDYDCSKIFKKIVLLKVVNGGHIIPNPSFQYWPKFLGNVNKDIDSPKIIFNFFMKECP